MNIRVLQTGERVPSKYYIRDTLSVGYSAWRLGRGGFFNTVVTHLGVGRLGVEQKDNEQMDLFQ